MKHISTATGCALLFIAAACSNNQWHVKGTLEGGAGKEILVQASDNGRWYTLDTITTGKMANSNIPILPWDVPTCTD